MLWRLSHWVSREGIQVFTLQIRALIVAELCVPRVPEYASVRSQVDPVAPVGIADSFGPSLSSVRLWSVWRGLLKAAPAFYLCALAWLLGIYG